MRPAQCNRDDCLYFHPFGKDPTLWGSKGRCYFCGGPHMKKDCPHRAGRPAEWFIPPGTATHRGPVGAAAPQVITIEPPAFPTLSLGWCKRGQSLTPHCLMSGADSDVV